jgi:hypothetical protein
MGREVKKMRKLLIGVVLTVAAVGCTAQAAERDSEPVSDYGSEPEITAEMVVDFGGPALTAEFCDSYYVLGYDLSLAAFSEGYHEADPSAAEMVDELVSRC